MKTNKEIETFFKELYHDAYKDKGVKIKKLEDKIEVKITQMYQYVPVDFKILCKIGEFFGTDKVNGSKGEYYDGCETCDYGSSYEVDFVIEIED